MFRLVSPFGRIFGFAIVITSSVCGEELQQLPRYGRDIRPILAKHCFTCHGPDEGAREADLRLDKSDPDAATEVIVPGDPDASELIARITSDDPDTRMPPADAHPPLSADDIGSLRKWIQSGAAYEQHWAFVPPERPGIPKLDSDSWSRGALDSFLLRAMRDHGLTPSPEAGREDLIRRLYLDLTGVAPHPDVVDRFLRDDRPQAYRRVVDGLLASPEYAERFARPWLDLARYSDTNGYEKDRPRTIWPFRDWVIRAIAADMPYDQFSIQQLAGDMLDEATAEQRIATGFHRNTMINEEGGIDPQEYRFYSIVDRVATTGTVWLGLTVGCAQCHTHKYDPITHQDYYSFFALLNNADEPDLVVPDEGISQRREQLAKQIAELQQSLADTLLPDQQELVSDSSLSDPIHQAFAKWIGQQIENWRPWQVIRPAEWESTMPKLKVLEDGSVLASGDVTKRDVYRFKFDMEENATSYTALRLEVLPHESLPAGGPGLAFYEGRRGDFFLSELVVRWNGKQVKLRNPSHSYGKISVGSGKAAAENVIDGEGSTGWSTAEQEGQANQLVVNFDQALQGRGQLEVELLFERHFAASLGHFRLSITDGPDAVARKLPLGLDDTWSEQAEHVSELPAEVFDQLRRYFVLVAPELKEQRKKIDQLTRQTPKFVRTLSLQQREQNDYRTTHRHHRGEYLKPKEEVAAAIPTVFEIAGTDPPSDRLALARWLMSPSNPLIGRVTANRAWREFFGTGIVRTAGDFGTQSEMPSHPDLLDWLAVDLREGDWSLKRLHRQIVLSAAYRSRVGPAPQQDPDNRFLSTFPYRRLDAELIRDTMLSASGLLSRQIGGPSVYPPQPASVSKLAYGSPAWKVSAGGDRYRRSLYTFSKRTAPFAAYLTFDGPTGENCIARRDESTTPLQALTLLNDQMFLDIARGLATDTLRELPADANENEIARRMFRKLLVRRPTVDELAAIVAFYHQQSGKKDPWMLVARALLNTDEAITVP